MNYRKLLIYNLQVPLEKRIELSKIEKKREMVKVRVSNIEIHCQIRAEIAPKVAEIRKRDELFNSVGHFEKEKTCGSAKTSKYVIFFGQGYIDETDVAAENCEVFATIKEIKKMSKLEKLARMETDSNA